MSHACMRPSAGRPVVAAVARQTTLAVAVLIALVVSGAAAQETGPPPPSLPTYPQPSCTPVELGEPINLASGIGVPAVYDCQDLQLCVERDTSNLGYEMAVHHQAVAETHVPNLLRAMPLEIHRHNDQAIDRQSVSSLYRELFCKSSYYTTADKDETWLRYCEDGMLMNREPPGGKVHAGGCNTCTPYTLVSKLITVLAELQIVLIHTDIQNKLAHTDAGISSYHVYSSGESPSVQAGLAPVSEPDVFFLPFLTGATDAPAALHVNHHTGTGNHVNHDYDWYYNDLRAAIIRSGLPLYRRLSPAVAGVPTELGSDSFLAMSVPTVPAAVVHLFGGVAYLPTTTVTQMSTHTRNFEPTVVSWTDDGRGTLQPLVQGMTSSGFVTGGMKIERDPAGESPPVYTPYYTIQAYSTFDPVVSVPTWCETNTCVGPDGESLLPAGIAHCHEEDSATCPGPGMYCVDVPILNCADGPGGTGQRAIYMDGMPILARAAACTTYQDVYLCDAPSGGPTRRRRAGEDSSTTAGILNALRAAGAYTDAVAAGVASLETQVLRSQIELSTITSAMYDSQVRSHLQSSTDAYRARVVSAWSALNDLFHTAAIAMAFRAIAVLVNQTALSDGFARVAATAGAGTRGTPVACCPIKSPSVGYCLQGYLPNGTHIQISPTSAGGLRWVGDVTGTVLSEGCPATVPAPGSRAMGFVWNGVSWAWSGVDAAAANYQQVTTATSQVTAAFEAADLVIDQAIHAASAEFESAMSTLESDVAAASQEIEAERTNRNNREAAMRVDLLGSMKGLADDAVGPLALIGKCLGAVFGTLLMLVCGYLMYSAIWPAIRAAKSEDGEWDDEAHHAKASPTVDTGDFYRGPSIRGGADWTPASGQPLPKDVVSTAL